jgi:thioredoxin-like negative regulator of GroEL
VNAHWLPVFDASKKKDDLADTVMQAISFTKRVETVAKPKVPKKLVARKPNDNQKRTKYSKSNFCGSTNTVWDVKTTNGS